MGDHFAPSWVHGLSLVSLLVVEKVFSVLPALVLLLLCHGLETMVIKFS